jgi:hypothetical protein
MASSTPLTPRPCERLQLRSDWRFREISSTTRVSLTLSSFHRAQLPSSSSLNLALLLHIGLQRNNKEFDRLLGVSDSIAPVLYVPINAELTSTRVEAHLSFLPSPLPFSCSMPQLFPLTSSKNVELVFRRFDLLALPRPLSTSADQRNFPSPTRLQGLQRALPSLSPLWSPSPADRSTPPS